MFSPVSLRMYGELRAVLSRKEWTDALIWPFHINPQEDAVCSLHLDGRNDLAIGHCPSEGCNLHLRSQPEHVTVEAFCTWEEVAGNLKGSPENTSARSGLSWWVTDALRLTGQVFTCNFISLQGQESLKEMCGRTYLRLGWWEMHRTVAGALPSGVVIFDSKFAG